MYRNQQEQTGENPATNLSHLATSSSLSLDRLVYQHSDFQPLSYQRSFQDAASQGNAALFPRHSLEQSYHSLSMTPAPREVQSIEYSLAGADDSPGAEEYDFDTYMLETRSVLTKENHLNEAGEVEAGEHRLDPTELEDVMSTTYMSDDHLEALAGSIFQYRAFDDEEDNVTPQPYALHIIDESSYFLPEVELAANDDVEVEEESSSDIKEEEDKDRKAA